MKLKKQNNIIIAIAMIFTFIAASCSKSNSGNVAPTTPAVTGVQLSANSKFGNIITDNNNQTLYFFAIDANGKSGCNGGCDVVWKPFYKAAPTIGTGLSATDFTTITRTDGSMQTAYKGWPLYYYAQDTQTGTVNGDGVDKTWFVAKADYTVMIANAQLIGGDGNPYLATDFAGTGVSQYLTDANGLTLYQFAKDTHAKDNFETGDATHDALWPILSLNAGIQSIPSILDKTQFDVITIFGKIQVTYKGHPLYAFANDKAIRGNTFGVNFPTAGSGIWKVVNSDTPVL